MENLHDKPPIGLTPRHQHDQQRTLEILNAMLRYIAQGTKPPGIWLKELNTLYPELF